MESASSFNMNTVTETYWLIYAAATVIWPYHVGYYFQSLEFHWPLVSTTIPCPVDRDDIVPLNLTENNKTKKLPADQQYAGDSYLSEWCPHNFIHRTDTPSKDLN